MLLLLFIFLRLLCKIFKPSLLNKTGFKVLAHGFDAGVIALGLTLWHFNHWTFYDWLLLKFVIIAVYIFSTFVTFKKAANVFSVMLFGLLSVSSLVFIIALAHRKTLMFL